jgi:hypothetical protein
VPRDPSNKGEDGQQAHADADIRCARYHGSGSPNLTASVAFALDCGDLFEGDTHRLIPSYLREWHNAPFFSGALILGKSGFH